MAKFCLDCWNKINNTHDPAIKYILSEELEICEECGQMKRVIIITRSARCRIAIKNLFPRLKRKQ